METTFQNELEDDFQSKLITLDNGHGASPFDLTTSKIFVYEPLVVRL